MEWPWKNRGNTLKCCGNTFKNMERCKKKRGRRSHQKLYFLLCWIWNHEQNNIIQMCNFLMRDWQCSKPSVVEVCIDYLVGGIPTPLKNMSSSLGIILPNWMENKIHVPNHQPDYIPPGLLLGVLLELIETIIEGWSDRWDIWGLHRCKAFGGPFVQRPPFVRPLEPWGIWWFKNIYIYNMDLVYIYIYTYNYYISIISLWIQVPS